MSYGSILGHEVIFGHHTDAEINCHHQDSDCCDNHHGDEVHIPCLVDIDPHFGSVHDLIIYPEKRSDIDLNLHILISLHNPDLFIVDDKEVLPDRVIPELYSSLFKRSHGLRGPPIA
jgi:hypothetical protein